MEQRGLESPRQPEGEKPKEKPKTSLLEKLRGRWPRRLTYLLAGMGLVASLETKTGVPSAALRRIKHEIILSLDAEKTFSRSFEITEESSRWEVFAVVETTPAAVEQLRADPNFYGRDVMGSSDDKKYIAVRFLQDTEAGKAALNQYKNQGLISNFIVDSVEVRSDLEKGDYRNILGILFGEGKSFKKVLALMDRVRIIDSPPEERKMPEAYGIKGEEFAHFRSGGGFYNIIEFQKTFVERSDLFDETDTFFHEMGHALAYVTGNGSYFPKSWPDVMKKDASLRRDNADTFFSYPMAIKNPDLRAGEDFAESVSYYFMAPGFLFGSAPGRFEIVDKIVKGYLEDPKFDIRDKSRDLFDYLSERNSKEYTKLKTRMHEDYNKLIS